MNVRSSNSENTIGSGDEQRVNRRFLFMASLAVLLVLWMMLSLALDNTPSDSLFRAADVSNSETTQRQLTPAEQLDALHQSLEQIEVPSVEETLGLAAEDDTPVTKPTDESQSAF